jgi:hypothetical protein
MSTPKVKLLETLESNPVPSVFGVSFSVIEEPGLVSTILMSAESASSARVRRPHLLISEEAPFSTAGLPVRLMM